jgi:chromosome segregation ATPase
MSSKPRPGGKASGAKAPTAAAKYKKIALLGRSNAFTTLVENTVDAYTSQSDGAVEDVRRILADLRRQYDEVHNEGEKREREIVRLREAIRQADALHSTKSDELYKAEDLRNSLQRQLDDTQETIQDALTNRKVYVHMLERLKKERAVLKQKLLQMEGHLHRKTAEHDEKLSTARVQRQSQAQTAGLLECCEYELEHEREKTNDAIDTMHVALTAKKSMIKRRTDFAKWRHEVSLEAANEAFNASAGRLKKLWAVEKLGGNCLQKIIFEQVEKSQATEDGFQKIREVTGLTDVMDIVHKFLNRDVEHEQLKSAVKEAESRLESLREEFEHFKRETEGAAPVDLQEGGRSRAIYQEVDECEANLNKYMQDHANARERLQKSTLTLEQMRAWARRSNRSLLPFEDAAQLDSDPQLRQYFHGLKTTVDKFLYHIQQQNMSGKLQKKAGGQRTEKEHHEMGRLLNDKDFLKANARVPVTERPASAMGKQGQDEFDDPFSGMAQEREKFKSDAEQRIAEAVRKSAKDKKKQERR